MYSYPKIGEFNNTPPISASPITLNGLDPHSQLLEYCQKIPKYNSMIHQVREKTFVTELKFRFDDQLTAIQIDQFLAALLLAMVSNDVNRMDEELSHFNAFEISKIKQMYAVACALDMGNDEIRQRNFELDTAGYMEYLVKLR